MSKDMLIELMPKFFFIPGECKGRFPYSNGLLIDSSLRVLVDAGFGLSRREEILRNGDVDVIINTHFHLDHAFGNKYFPKAEIWAHVLDAPALRSKKEFLAYSGLDHTPDFPEGYPFPHGMPGRAVGRELAEGEILDFGNVVLQVLHTPGHTPGHISLYEPKEGILFSGDIDLSPFGPFYGNTSSNLEEFSKSIRRLIDLNPKVLVTSHSPIISDNIPERLKEYAEIIDLRATKLLQALRVPRSKQELMEMKIIYDHYPEPQSLYRYFEEVMIGKHLRHLMGLGEVKLMANQKYKAYA
ncbi:MBL fold metallo-hydrolase [Desulfosporosinus hippei]|uniref:Glyoxylase, beta-lactamase superfamily II n=1 Tax=Desulfosporosinus hippei DSM 8344 TaxID=1121419 RepID=A0A1G8I1L0_9FIRM|nr:MBL fold metallo-hydrolase [Desulfosporosinus hippei]SDI12799.1 Glyoxylase, beta-lactamase superfamily II [Desulfosporosinus hippei DSM 8344]